MKRLILIFVVFTLVLTACGYKDRKSVESFAGESVATISNSSQSNGFATEITDDDEGQIGTTDPAATSTYQAPQTLIAPNVSQEPDQSNPPGYAASQSPYPIGNDPTITPTPPSPTRTATSSVTVTLSPNFWEGEWKVHFETADGVMKTGTLVFTRDPQDADKIVGSGTIDGKEYQFNGYLRYDDFYIKGNWRDNLTSGDFWIRRDQFAFVGSNDGTRAFCGARPGTAFPTECFEGVPS
jgi:hypothetical protein